MKRLLGHLLVALVLGHLALAPLPVRAQESEDDAESAESAEELDPGETEIVRMKLEEAISRAVQLSPEIAVTEQALAVSETYVSQAKRARWLPSANMIYTFTGINEARGDIFYSPDSDTDFLNGLGPYNRIQLDVVQPLYTFGKLDAALKRALAGVDVAAASVDDKVREIRERVKMAYWGLLLGRDAEKILLDVQKNLDKAFDSMQEKLDAETGEVTNVDVYKMELFRARLGTRVAELQQKLGIARRTMKRMLVLEPNQRFQPADRSLKPPKEELQPLDYYVGSAMQNRKEMRQVRAGIRARTAEVEAARGGMYPDIFIGGHLEWSSAPNRSDLTNPLVGETFNRFVVGPFLGLRWDLSLHRKHAELKTARAMLMEMEANKAAAEFGFSLKVEDAYLNVIRAQKTHDSLEQALRSAKKWFRSTTLNFNIGVAGTDDLLNAYGSYVDIRGTYLESVFEYHTAWSKLKEEAALPLPVTEEESP